MARLLLAWFERQRNDTPSTVHPTPWYTHVLVEMRALHAWIAMRMRSATKKSKNRFFKDTAETTEPHLFHDKIFSRFFLFWLPSDLQAGPAPNVPRLGYATPYLASGCYADHIASV